jgi:hypothetical protein
MLEFKFVATLLILLQPNYGKDKNGSFKMLPFGNVKQGMKQGANNCYLLDEMVQPFIPCSNS